MGTNKTKHPLGQRTGGYSVYHILFFFSGWVGVVLMVSSYRTDSAKKISGPPFDIHSDILICG